MHHVGMDAPARSDLWAAAHLTLTLRAATEEAQRLVDAILPQVWSHSGRKNAPRSEDGKQAQRRAVAATVGELLVHHHHGAAEGVGGISYRPMNRKHFTNLNPSNPDHVSFRDFEWVFAGLAGADMIEVFGSHQHFHTTPEAVKAGRKAEAGKRFATRLRPTPALLHAAHDAGVTLDDIGRHFVRPDGLISKAPIELRDLGAWVGGSKNKGHDLPIPDTADAKTLRADVLAMNRFAAAHRVETSEPTPPLAWWRAFNVDFELHGRWYAVGKGYQGFEGDTRASMIRIDGSPTVEVDVSASHLTCIYGFLGLPFDPSTDPYAGTTFPRGVIKAWTTASIGSGQALSGSEWPKEAVARAKRNGIMLTSYALPDVSRAATERHPVMAELPDRFGFLSATYGVKTQRVLPLFVMGLEARAITHAMLSLKARDVLALPVHDSLIVSASRMQDAKDALADAFSGTLRVVPRLKP